MLPDGGVVVMSQGGTVTQTRVCMCVFVRVCQNMRLYKFGLRQEDLSASGADFTLQINFSCCLTEIIWILIRL